MQKLKHLKSIGNRSDFAKLLGVTPAALTYCLYIGKVENQYHRFSIPKRSGGQRIIYAPSPVLKEIQKSLSLLLLDCLDEITTERFPNSQLSKVKKISGRKDYSADILKVKISAAKIKQPSLSHGFARDRSIITNAMMHIGKKNILNIDLKDFFDSFNFGRVRGFFIKNENFKLVPEVATVIAQIACFDNKLPQGSPCSPVITNLITHVLDVRLASLAKKYKCTYTRYADDITFSTRLAEFPTQLMKQERHTYKVGEKLKHEIKRAGFQINHSKTRIQYKSSRQEVTGLVANKKPSVKNEYRRLVRAKCDQLFKTGSFFVTHENGSRVSATKSASFI